MTDTDTKVFDWLSYFIFKQMAIFGLGSDPDDWNFQVMLKLDKNI